jgi:hypothetical protein
MAQQIQLTPDEQKIIQPFVTAANAMVRGFAAGVAEAQRLLIDQILAARTVDPPKE